MQTRSRDIVPNKSIYIRMLLTQNGGGGVTLTSVILHIIKYIAAAEAVEGWKRRRVELL